LTAKILPRFKQKIQSYRLVPSKGGCFELTVGGRKLYSKLQTGQFPDEDALVEDVARVLGG
jgi:selenoprotein W-related protein